MWKLILIQIIIFKNKKKTKKQAIQENILY